MTRTASTPPERGWCERAEAEQDLIPTEYTRMVAASQFRCGLTYNFTGPTTYGEWVAQITP
jgi:hypothetical protein